MTWLDRFLLVLLLAATLSVVLGWCAAQHNGA